MRRLALLLALAVALSAACGSGDEPASTSRPLLPVASSVEATTTAPSNAYEPIRLPLATRAWLNRTEGALVVESCPEVDAYLAQGHTLAELVEHRSYACGPTVTSMVVAGEKGIADLFTPR